MELSDGRQWCLQYFYWAIFLLEIQIKSRFIESNIWEEASPCTRGAAILGRKCLIQGCFLFDDIIEQIW